MLHNNHLKRYTLQFSMIIIHIHAQLYKTQHYKKRSSYFQLFNIHVFNKISPQQDLLPSSEKRELSRELSSPRDFVLHGGTEKLKR